MHYKQNNKESKTYVQGLRRFGNTLPRGIRGILKKNGYHYSEIISKWKYLVGKDISDFCHPKSIKTMPKSKSGTLILLVERGNEINIEYSKIKIIDRVNAYFGFKLINNIKLQSYNSITKKEKENKIINKSSKKLKEKIDEIKNTNIRESLSQLLDVIKK